MNVFIILGGIILLAVFTNVALAAKPEIPPELQQSLETRVRMNELLESYGFHRPKNICEFEVLRDAGALVRVTNPEGDPIFYLDRESRGIKQFPYLRPEAKKFLEEEVAKEFFASTGVPFKIPSLIRTIAYQIYLEAREVSDATEQDPRRRSTHPSGFAFDISKRLANRVMNDFELDVLREILVYWEREGMIDAIEERAGFHVSVSPVYAGLSPEDVRDEEIMAPEKKRCSTPAPVSPKKKIFKKKPIIKKSPKR